MAKWLTVVPVSGTGNTQLLISAEPHTGNAPRNATFNVKNKGGTQPSININVAQEPSPNVLKVSHTGYTITDSSLEAGQNFVEITRGIAIIMSLEGYEPGPVATEFFNEDATSIPNTGDVGYVVLGLTNTTPSRFTMKADITNVSSTLILNLINSVLVLGITLVDRVSQSDTVTFISVYTQDGNVTIPTDFARGSLVNMSRGVDFTGSPVTVVPNMAGAGLIDVAFYIGIANTSLLEEDLALPIIINADTETGETTESYTFTLNVKGQSSLSAPLNVSIPHTGEEVLHELTSNDEWAVTIQDKNTPA